MEDITNYKSRDHLHRLIFYSLHKKLSEKEFLYDDEIRFIIIQIFQELLPEGEIHIINNDLIQIHFQNRIYKINIQQWVDSIKVLFNQYIDYIQK